MKRIEYFKIKFENCCHGGVAPSIEICTVKEALRINLIFLKHPPRTRMDTSKTKSISASYSMYPQEPLLLCNSCCKSIMRWVVKRANCKNTMLVLFTAGTLEKLAAGSRFRCWNLFLGSQKCACLGTQLASVTWLGKHLCNSIALSTIIHYAYPPVEWHLPMRCPRWSFPPWIERVCQRCTDFYLISVHVRLIHQGRTICDIFILVWAKITV